MHEGRVLINISGSEIKKSNDQVTVLSQLEYWLNNEIAIEAYKKFKVGLRVHLSFGNVKDRKRA